MSMPPRYLLDASVFIEAHRRYYAFDICPGFWQALLAHHHDGKGLFSIDKVREELLRGTDALADWVKRQVPRAAFLATGEAAVMRCYAEIITWVEAQGQFMPAAKAKFAHGADGWLAAYAKVHGFVVITQEVANPEAKKKVPLPNVCAAFGVPTLDTFEMLRRIEARFGWTGTGRGRSIRV